MEREEIKKKLKETGLKQEHVAKAIGKHPSVLAQALSGTLPYSEAKVLAETSRYLGELAPGAKIISEK